jgi:peptidyl-prolyl cis-trans isomerase D
MFDYFRNNIKFLMGILMLLIIPAFVLVGVEGYSNLRESRDIVAKVGQLDIAREEWDAAHRNEIDRLVASMPGIERSLIDNESSRFATLERLINERVLALAADEGLYLATDQRLARELTQDPSIASLRRPDGTLDVERYQQLLRAQPRPLPHGHNAVRKPALAEKEYQAPRPPHKRLAANPVVS